MKFSPGQLTATPGALEAIRTSGTRLTSLLSRHVSGDWGDMTDDDKALNDDALASGEGRIFSAYRLSNGVKIWVITDADRDYTTFMLPGDY